MLPEGLRERLTWVTEGVAVIEPDPDFAGATSMLIDDGDVVLVDAGLSPAQCEALAPHVDAVILTHTHLAHSRGAADFAGKVWAPREEARALASLDEYVDVMGVQRQDRAAARKWVEEAGFRACEVTKKYRPGGVIQLASHEWHFFPAPGHSPGMTLLLDPNRHILFGADFDDHQHGPWYGWPSCDADDLERSALELAQIDVAILVTSHAPPRRRGIKPMFRAIAETIRERDKHLLEALETPRTLDDLVQRGIVSGLRPQSPEHAFHERVMVEKHLGRLMAKDYAAARQDGRYERLA